MSIWSHVFDSEWSQRSDINSLQQRSSKIARLQRKQNQKSAVRIDALEEEVGELTLLCRSLLTILRENGAIDPARLDEVMQQIDLEDGVLDGKVTTPEKPQAPTLRRRTRKR